MAGVEVKEVTIVKTLTFALNEVEPAAGFEVTQVLNRFPWETDCLGRVGRIDIREETYWGREAGPSYRKEMRPWVWAVSLLPPMGSWTSN